MPTRWQKKQKAVGGEYEGKISCMASIIYITGPSFNICYDLVEHIIDPAVKQAFEEDTEHAVK